MKKCIARKNFQVRRVFRTQLNVCHGVFLQKLLMTMNRSQKSSNVDITVGKYTSIMTLKNEVHLSAIASL